MFSPSLFCEPSGYLCQLVSITTMTSADFPEYRYQYSGISPGKSIFLPPIPAASTYLPLLYSLGIARTWLLTRITMPHIPFLFVSTGFCCPVSLLTLVFIFIRVRDCFAIQCILYSIPPCGLLILPGVPGVKGTFAPWKIAHSLLARKSLFVYLNFFYSLQQVCAA